MKSHCARGHSLTPDKLVWPCIDGSLKVLWYTQRIEQRRTTMATIKIECKSCNGTGNDPEADCPLYGCQTCQGEGFFEEWEEEDES